MFGFWLKDPPRDEFAFARAPVKSRCPRKRRGPICGGMLKKAGIDPHNRPLNLAVLAKAAGMPVSTRYSRLKQHGNLACSLH